MPNSPQDFIKKLLPLIQFLQYAAEKSTNYAAHYDLRLIHNVYNALTKIQGEKHIIYSKISGVLRHFRRKKTDESIFHLTPYFTEDQANRFFELIFDNLVKLDIDIGWTFPQAHSHGYDPSKDLFPIDWFVQRLYYVWNKHKISNKNLQTILTLNPLAHMNMLQNAIIAGHYATIRKIIEMAQNNKQTIFKMISSRYEYPLDKDTLSDLEQYIRNNALKNLEQYIKNNINTDPNNVINIFYCIFDCISKHCTSKEDKTKQDKIILRQLRTITNLITPTLIKYLDTGLEYSCPKEILKTIIDYLVYLPNDYICGNGNDGLSIDTIRVNLKLTEKQAPIIDIEELKNIHKNNQVVILEPLKYNSQFPNIAEYSDYIIYTNIQQDSNSCASHVLWLLKYITDLNTNNNLKYSFLVVVNEHGTKHGMLVVYSNDNIELNNILTAIENYRTSSFMLNNNAISSHDHKIVLDSNGNATILDSHGNSYSIEEYQYKFGVNPNIDTLNLYTNPFQSFISKITANIADTWELINSILDTNKPVAKLVQELINQIMHSHSLLYQVLNKQQVFYPLPHYPNDDNDPNDHNDNYELYYYNTNNNPLDHHQDHTNPTNITYAANEDLEDSFI